MSDQTHPVDALASQQAGWRHVDDARKVPIEGDVTVPASVWREHRDALSWRDGRTGVRLGPSESLDALGPFLDRVSLVVLEAGANDVPSGPARQRILRERYHYAGEIRVLESAGRQPRRTRARAASNGTRRPVSPGGAR